MALKVKQFLYLSAFITASALWYFRLPGLGYTETWARWYKNTAGIYNSGELFGLYHDGPFTKPVWPLAAIFLYVIGIKLFSPSKEAMAQAKKASDEQRKSKKPKPMTAFRAMCLLHNTCLCLFSFWAFTKSSTLIPPVFWNFGEGVGGKFETLYVDTEWGNVVYLFYLSKIYELADTFILLAQNKPSNLLQTFHHIGAIIGMWWCTVCHASSGYLFVGLNSFIHTLMYGYYAMTLLNLHPPRAVKILLTSSQMVQFLAGNTISFFMYSYGTMKTSHVIITVYHNIYTTILFALFLDFARKKYISKKGKKPPTERTLSAGAQAMEHMEDQNNKRSRRPGWHSGMHKDYWYVDGEAYDFSTWVNKHPGGQWAVNLFKGREGKGLIYSYHLDIDKIEKLLDQYKLPEKEQLKYRAEAEFAPNQKFTFRKDGFYRTVKREALKYFRDNKLDWKMDCTHLLLQLVIIGTQFATYAGICLYLRWGLSIWAAVGCALVHGLMRALVVMQTTHGASHFSLHWSGTLNRWWYRLGTVIIGLWAPSNWDIQHVVAHHVYTNEWPYDADTGFPIRSYLFNQKRYWFHEYQHYYSWLVYALTLPFIWMNAIREFFTGRQVKFKFRYNNPGEYIEHIIILALEGVYMALPFILAAYDGHSWAYAFWISLMTNVISSLIFSLQFVVNHDVDIVVTEENAKHPKWQYHATKDKNGRVDFGEHQMEESCTFNAEIWWSLELAGGLNTQIEHHLFPNVHYGHYNNLTSIVKRVAKDFNVPYNHTGGWIESIMAHYRLLKTPVKSERMIQKPRPKPPKEEQIPAVAVTG